MIDSQAAQIDQLAAALKRAAAEHGIPNSFSAAELEQYGAPGRLVIGRIGTRLIDRLTAALGDGYRLV